jgi:hypothetical protein
MKPNFLKIKKTYSLLCNVIGLAIAIYVMYSLLLKHDEFPLSIIAILHSLCNWVDHSYVLIVGLLPIYIAVMIFGLAILGLYLGSLLEHFVARLFPFSKKD